MRSLQEPHRQHVGSFSAFHFSASSGRTIMKSSYARAAATLAIALGLGVVEPSYALPPLETPFQLLSQYEFQEAGAPGDWDMATGAWAADGQTYNVTAAAAQSISVINTYQSNPYSEPSPIEVAREYVYRLRLMNPSAAAETRVGFVYNFQDPANYYELVFSPTGIAQVRRMIAGAVTVVFEAPYKEGGPTRWVNAELYANGTQMHLVVNGNTIISGLQQGELPQGRLGLVAHGTTAKFDHVIIDLVTDHPMKETFDDGLAQRFPDGVDSNNWKIENGVLKNFTVLYTNKIAVARQAGWFGQTNTLRVRLRNPYGARGNLVGVYFDGGNLEVLFSRTGFVRLDSVRLDGTRTTLASAPIPKLSSDWFEIVVACGVFTDVFLNGQLVLSYILGPNASPYDAGLVTHWSPGEFDRVDFNDAFLIEPYTASFDADGSSGAIVSGSWLARGGTYNSTAAGTADISTLSDSPSQPYAPERSMDFTYRARLLTPASAQQSVGLVTHYSGGEYYEVLLTGEGQIIAKKHVQRTVRGLASGTYTAAPNTWVTLELRCIRNKTSILVNGSQRVSGVLQGQLRGGRAGVITHSTPGKFDDVVFAEIK
jgi:hypothetical protein